MEVLLEIMAGKSAGESFGGRKNDKRYGGKKADRLGWFLLVHLLTAFATIIDVMLFHIHTIDHDDNRNSSICMSVGSLQKN